jgi:hypothetical protein
MSTMEDWLRPKLVACLPKETQDWITQRVQQGRLDSTPNVLFDLFKRFGPGGPRERAQLIQYIINPKPQQVAKGAQTELNRWMDSVRRCIIFKISAPDKYQGYVAMESIFSNLFERAEPQLNFRWISLRNDLSLPSILKQGVFQTMYTRAYQELSQLIILGGSSLNPGLPLTDHQRTHRKQQQEGDKKRAAAARTDTQTLVDEQVKAAIPKAIKQYQGSLPDRNAPKKQKAEPPSQPSAETPPRAAAFGSDPKKPDQKVRHA